MNAPAKIIAAEAVESCPHVLIAINSVTQEIGREGIAKGRENTAQKYKFRGIDDMYNALSPLIAKHKLIIKPRGLSREVTERAGRSYEGKPATVLIYTNVTFEYDFISAVDGSRETFGPFYGEAMDSGDKATNKAQSAAYKYMAIQAFAIPTEGDNDADASTYEVEPRRDNFQKRPAAVVGACAAIECLRTEDDCARWYKDNLATLKAQPQAERDEILAYLKQRKAALEPLPSPAKDDFRRGGARGVARGDRHAPADATPFDTEEAPF